MDRAKKRRDPFEVVTAVYLFLLLTLFLFFCGITGYQGISEAKFQVFCLVCGGYVAVMAVLALERCLIGDLKLFSPRELLRRSSWVQRLIAAYLLLTWVSALASPYFPETLVGVSRYEGAVSITLYCLSFLLVSVYGRAGRPLLWVYCPKLCGQHKKAL